MDQIQDIYNLIIDDLKTAGSKSLYVADANEPDSRYKSYGVRAKGKKEIIVKHKAVILALSREQKIKLASKLMKSKYGEQQSVALFILEQIPNCFSPENFDKLDDLIRCIHGWSKVDSFTGSILRDTLFNYPTDFIQLVRKWNKDEDMWLKRTSTVLFTRKVAKSGKFTDTALEMCNNLIYDEEPLVLKGVGWALKDLMKSDKKQIIDYLKDLRKKRVSSILTLYAMKDLKGKEREEILSIK